jgi:hypothetical protein
MVFPRESVMILSIFIVGIQGEDLFIELSGLVIIMVFPGSGRTPAESPDMVLDKIKRLGFLLTLALLNHAQEGLLILEVFALLLRFAPGESLLGTLEIGIYTEVKGSMVDPINRPVVSIDSLVVFAILEKLHGTIEVTLDLIAKHLSLDCKLLTNILGDHGHLTPAVSAKHADLIEELLGGLVGGPELQSLLKLQLGLEQFAEGSVLAGFAGQGG